MGFTNPMTFVALNTGTAAQMNTYLRDNTDFLKENISLETAGALTLAVGAITITKSFHILTSEAATTDDLTSIAIGTTGMGEGTIVVLMAAVGHTITIKSAAYNIFTDVDIVLSGNKQVALIDYNGNWYLLYTARDVTFMVNNFQYPLSGTDWTPQLEGAGLAASLAAKKVWVPLNFLKIGDAIVSYKLVGDATEAAALTLDCKLVRINLADPLTTTDVVGGGITQITAGGNFDSLATLTAAEVVATDKQYTLEILGTTGAGDSITVIGAEVLIRRLA
ncbi:MAG: hypothetical protein MUP49_02185 [Dehalococcoidia bacterium]|nr:hypothetical protein [Dehalococcoidia bacterium]